MISQTIRIVQCVVPSPAMSVRGWTPESSGGARGVIRATDVGEDLPHGSSTGERAAALTGLRAVAALIIVGTHAAYGTGQLPHGFVGALYARWRSVCRSSSSCRDSYCSAHGCGLLRTGRGIRWWAGMPAVELRRIAPAYVVTVLIAYLIYQFRDVGPNPGHTWMGLLEHLTLTQIYPPVYFFVMHQGLTQTWSLAVEFAFYAALPLMAALLLRALCEKGTWRPGLLLAGLAVLGPRSLRRGSGCRAPPTGCPARLGCGCPPICCTSSAEWPWQCCKSSGYVCGQSSPARWQCSATFSCRRRSRETSTSAKTLWQRS